MAELFLLWFKIADGWVIALALISMQITLGRRLVTVCGRSKDFEHSGGLRWFYYFLIGFWSSSLLLTILAFLPWRSNAWLFIYLIPLSFLNLYEAWGWIQRCKARPVPDRNDPHTPSSLRWLKILAVVLFFVWFAPYIIQSFLPNSDWDVAAYHYPLAKRILLQGICAVDVDVAQFNFPASIHLIYALMLSIGEEMAILPLNLLASLAAVVGVWFLTRRFWTLRAANWAAAICLSSNVLLELGLDARVDGFLVLFVLIAMMVFLEWLDSESKSSTWLLLLGMALGLAFGVKYTAVLIAGPLMLAVALLIIKNKQISSQWAGCCLLLLAMLFPAGWWYGRNAVALGDPMYPGLGGWKYHNAQGQLRSLEKDREVAIATYKESPAYQGVLATLPKRQEQSGISRSTINLIDIIHRSFGKDRIDSRKYARKPFHWLSPFVLIFFLLPFCNRQKLSLWLYALTIIFYLLLGSQTELLRYLLPVLPLFSIGAGILISEIRRRQANVFLGALLFALLISNVSAEWKKVQLKRADVYLLGVWNRRVWEENAGYSNAYAAVKLMYFIQQNMRAGNLDSEASVMMIWEGKGYLLDCEYFPDTGFAATPWMGLLLRHDFDYDAVYQEMLDRNVRYLVINDSYRNWVLQYTMIEPDVVALPLFHLVGFIRRYAAYKIYYEDGIMLLEINRPTDKSSEKTDAIVQGG